MPLQHPGRAYAHIHTVSIINSMPIPVQISPLPAIIRHTYGNENIQVNPITTKAMPQSTQVRAAAPNAAIKEISTENQAISRDKTTLANASRSGDAHIIRSTSPMVFHTECFFGGSSVTSSPSFILAATCRGLPNSFSTSCSFSDPAS